MNRNIRALDSERNLQLSLRENSEFIVSIHEF